MIETTQDISFCGICGGYEEAGGFGTCTCHIKRDWCAEEKVDNKYNHRLTESLDVKYSSEDA